jgi:hypothetical protein
MRIFQPTEASQGGSELPSQLAQIKPGQLGEMREHDDADGSGQDGDQRPGDQAWSAFGADRLAGAPAPDEEQGAAAAKGDERGGE